MDNERTRHDGCARKRSAALTRVHGDVEPLACVAVWGRLGSAISPAQHQGRTMFTSTENGAREVAKLINSARPAFVVKKCACIGYFFCLEHVQYLIESVLASS